MDQYPPLSDRVVKASGLGLAVAHRVQPASLYRGEYKKWSEERMALAVDAVMKDGISVRRAAEEYDIPKSTLGDRISGRILPGAVSDPGKYLYLTKKRKNLYAFCWSVRRLGILEATRRSLLLSSVCVIEMAFKRLFPMVGGNPSAAVIAI